MCYMNVVKSDFSVDVSAKMGNFVVVHQGCGQTEHTSMNTESFPVEIKKVANQHARERWPKPASS